ncbi:HPr-rel-A system PqqD family peptide chaperone [Sphingomonas hengshuiensis]|uniref:PqqD family protein n=1 Tax=Sphingomonas hengshuiensis TaxID=1609977 RepID=A0A7U4LG53_9SPHN|nr:HPr-rel-A system PqqD family peptide chaperone [Sphingomonas hengshuiensis]AJP72824.1 hypothetical protein TS85_15125 [Sphingomonas hengshuiensis]
MEQLFRRSGDIFAAPLDESVLLLNAETGRYHGLNGVAARIWEMLEQPVGEAELVSGLVAEFDVTPEECRREVSAFLTHLRDRGLLSAE